MCYFELSDQEQASFLGLCRHTVLEGPLSLVRFTDSQRGHAAAPGHFDHRTGIYRAHWMYAHEVAELLDAAAGTGTDHGPGPYGLKMVKQVSGRFAVCDDWSNLQRVWALNIPPGQTVHAYFGKAKFQPRASAKAQAASGLATDKSYAGGGVQLVLGLQRNQVAWIKGPLPTLALSKKKLAGLCKP